MNRPLRLFGSVMLPAITVSLAACSSAFNPIGSNTYDCNRKQDPTSIYCHSFRAVEASTNGRLPDSRFDTELKFSEYDKATDIAPPSRPDLTVPPLLTGAGQPVQLGSGGTTSQGAAALPTAAQPDMPVRMGPVIQRTWIKRFVDENDMWTSNLTVLKEITPSRWSGFDGGNPSRAAGGAYPHKVADAAQDASAAAVASAQSAPSAPTPATTDFIQPGGSPSGGENPAGISMPMSMPQ